MSMIGFYSSGLAPEAGDSLDELRRKAKGAIKEYQDFRFLVFFGVDNAKERKAAWRSVLDLLDKAASNPALEMDARLEALRCWAEEARYAAIRIVTMCVHLHSAAAHEVFQKAPEMREKLLADLERNRPEAIRVLSKEDLDDLRADGFLRPGE